MATKAFNQTAARELAKWSVMALTLALMAPLYSMSLLDQLGNMEYAGIYEKPVKLVSGQYEGSPYVPESSTRPKLKLIAGLPTKSAADNQNALVAYALLLEDSGGSGTFLYLSAVTATTDGLHNAGTIRIGDRVDIADFSTEKGLARLDLIIPDSDDPACCPTLMVSDAYGMKNGELVKLSREDVGIMSLERLSGTRWTLVDYDGNSPVPETISVTLQFEDDRVSGLAACNRYFGTAASDSPGALKIGPIGSTRKACPPPRMDAETRYLAALQNAQGYGFENGRLLITYATQDSTVALIFERDDSEAR